MKFTCGLLCTLFWMGGCGSALRPMSTSICYDAMGPVRESGPSAVRWIALLAYRMPAEHGCNEILPRDPSPRTSSCEWNAEQPSTTPVPARLMAHTHRDLEPDVIWIASEQTGDGRLRGPIAVVERTEFGLEVQAIGWYLGTPEPTRFQIWRVDGKWVVGVERNETGAQMLDVLVQYGRFLVPAMVEEHDGLCHGPARFTLMREEHRDARAGWSSRRVLSSTIARDGDRLVIEEHLTMQEIDLAHPDVPPRATFDANGRRALALHGFTLRADRPALSFESSQSDSLRHQ